MDINGYLYSGQNRVGTTSNPIWVTYSTTMPAEFVPLPPQPAKEVVKEIEKIVVKEVPYYNIHGDGIAFRLWHWIGEKMGWIHGR